MIFVNLNVDVDTNLELWEGYIFGKTLLLAFGTRKGVSQPGEFVVQSSECGFHYVLLLTTIMVDFLLLSSLKKG